MHRIKSQITYTPASQSFPASQKRRQAYEAGALIPGPIFDADGWFELPTASIRGIIDVDKERRLAVIDCTVSGQVPFMVIFTEAGGHIRYISPNQLVTPSSFT